jgi:hypothetical protein
MAQPPDPHSAPSSITAGFIARWERSGSAERANYSMFLTELCTLLQIPGPEPTRPDDRDNAYVFERAVPMDDGDGKTTIGRIDLYKRGAFVLEAKQGSTSEDGPTLFAPETPARTRRGTAVRGTPHWDAAMKKAKGQAERYVRSLPADEGNPPFILVVDVGHVIEVYSDFSRLGKTYTPFPDVQSYRIALDELKDDAVRKRLVGIWTDPLALDPARHSAKVTRQIAEKLAKLAKSFEAAGHHPETVAAFLMRCLFTFFAEDVGLIDRERSGEQPFTEMLQALRPHVDQFIPMAQDVWSRMESGGFSPAIRRKLKHFNGGLFKESHALPVTPEQLELLIEAGESDWSDVEPAIFGTLLERALEPRERHKLGAHYTPRAYVERLVLPTVIEPLREKWDAAKAAAFTLQFAGKNEEARKAIREFLAELCNTIVLDPACGSANFLYVTMEHMKKLEGEAREELRQLGETQTLLERGGLTVDPHQFLGLELNPRAVAIAELVLWIGYLKWHLRTLGHAPSEPLLRAFHNIKQQDAVLAYDRKEIVTDPSGKPVTRWDGHTMKVSSVTGEKIPNEAATVPLYRYLNARKAEWPKADYVVGNPPFIGNKRMRLALGDGYVEALRSAHDDLAETADFVMFWWDHAARLLRSNQLVRFGFITTNSITHPFNRHIVGDHLGETPPISLVFAVPDHPWVDATEGASVRISMTAAAAGKTVGRLGTVYHEEPDEEETRILLRWDNGQINDDLTVGASTTSSTRLAANIGISFMGVTLVGDGFKLSPTQAASLGYTAEGRDSVVRLYLSGKELTQKPQNRVVIDLHGRSEAEIRRDHPALYQWLLERVKPEREHNKRDSYRDKWWVFGEPRGNMRSALRSVERYIATIETGKHRFFSFLAGDVLPDHSLFAIALDDAFYLGVLNSRLHILWSLSAGATLEDRPRWRNVTCFEPFPFPDCTDAQKQRIRELGESLDAHRKQQQALHPGLTITDMYNVLEKLRKNTELTDKDRVIHEQGLVSVLKQIHDDLDAAVADAYGWHLREPQGGPIRDAQGRPTPISDEEILRRLVALNAERAEEEKHGVIRWLRPEFQNPAGTAASQGTLGLTPTEKTAKPRKAEKIPWPKSLAEQAQAVRAALGAEAGPASASELSKRFKGAKADRVGELLATLTALGQARLVGEERFVA